MSSLDASLPAPPVTLTRVIQAASDGAWSTGRLAKVVSCDPSFAVQLLRLVNSSVYARDGKVSSVERAIALLGTRSLRNLALCIAVKSCVQRKELGDYNLDAFWENSLRRAVASQLLAARVPAAGYDPTEAFTAGLLQDLGTLVLVRRRPEVADVLNEFFTVSPEERRAAEHELFGATHDDLAEQLAQAWSLPDELVVPMRYHHQPNAAPEAFEVRCRVAAYAELLTGVLSCEDKRIALEEARQVVSRWGDLTTDDVDELIGELSQRVTEIAHELEIPIGLQPTFEGILKAANNRLVELNLSYEELVSRLERALAEKEALAQQLARRNQELEQLSLTDELTRLPNRRSLSGRLTYEIRRVARGGTLVFAIADIDRFKAVNDRWGHDFGDLVLKGISATISEAVRDTDLAGRMGGEEFGIVLPGASLENCMVAAERILNAVRNHRFMCPDGVERHFTISLGLSALQGPYMRKAAVDRLAARLYKVADAALYRSKTDGRDRATVASDPVPWEESVQTAA